MLEKLKQLLGMNKTTDKTQNDCNCGDEGCCRDANCQCEDENCDCECNCEDDDCDCGCDDEESTDENIDDTKMHCACGNGQCGCKHSH